MSANGVGVGVAVEVVLVVVVVVRVCGGWRDDDDVVDDWMIVKGYW